MQKLPQNAKQERLEHLLHKLQQYTAGISVEDFARECGVCTKTIERDYKILKNLGVYRRNGLLFLDENKIFDELNADERAVLGILNELAKNNGDEFYQKAKPILAKLTQKSEESLLVKVPSERLDERNLADFSLIQDAILAKEKITFDFHKKNYVLKPLKLAFFDGFWYLMGFDEMENGEVGGIFKKFYFKDIENPRVLGEKFEVDSKTQQKLKSANSAWFSLNEGFIVAIHIDNIIAKYFMRKKLPNARILPQKDESIIIELEVSHELQIKPLIYQYIPHLRVLEPEWFAKSIAKEIRQFAKTLSQKPSL